MGRRDRGRGDRGTGRRPQSPGDAGHDARSDAVQDYQQSTHAGTSASPIGSEEYAIEMRQAPGGEAKATRGETGLSARPPLGLYRMTEDFATNACSAHGFPNIFKARRPLGRLVWSLVFLAGLGVFTWQASVLIARFFRYPVAVEIEIVSKTELGFPAVTLCNTNKVRRSAIKQSPYKEALSIDDAVTLPYYGPCLLGDFHCSSYGLCLKPFLLCDGINHCQDFSDEQGCDYDLCGSNEFQCTNGSALGFCISETLKCDRKKDCYDGQDEIGCTCKPSEFTCDQGACISKTRRCDNNPDCMDGLDENFCDSREPCGDFFKCQSDGKCLPHSFLCDGFKDCGDGEDEISSVCQSVQTTPAPEVPTCPESDFSCEDGWCIPQHWVCDNEVDCSTTGADEEAGLCGRSGEFFGEQRCQDGEILCANRWQCIHQSSLCDLHSDCSLSEDDENNCICRIQDSTTYDTQKVKCFGRSSVTAIPSQPLNSTVFTFVTCSNEMETVFNNLFISTLYACSGRANCFKGETGFPEPCKVFHECYVSPNAQDYRGVIDYVADNIQCLEWSHPLATEAGFSPGAYPELVGRLCRNPGGSRDGAWCFHVTAASTDDWSYCDVGQPSATCHEGAWLFLRLAGRDSDSEGRVEVGNGDGIWGTISDDNWTEDDGLVVCRDLGFDQVLSTSTFAAPDGPVFIASVECTGHESRLIDCQYRVVETPENVTHNLDVSVVCGRASRKKRQAEGPYEPSGDGNCADNEYLCGSGECVPLWQTCNTFPDCADGSDEYLDVSCPDTGHMCPVGEVACRNSPKCIARSFVCDGYSDCPRGVDEEFCNDPNEPCPDGYFRCLHSTRKCIHIYQVCDTIADCAGGEDETAECMYEDSDDGKANPFESDDWREPFLDFVPARIQPAFFAGFEDNFYVSRRFGRVKGERPADWHRFQAYSELPDYSDLAAVLKLDGEELHDYGHQAYDFLLQCSYDGFPCSPDDFEKIQNDEYGNCYIFNSETANAKARNSSRTGEQSGLALTLFIEHEEYISLHGREAGVRTVINQPNVAPLPSEEGINLMPGTVTFIGLRYNIIKRKPHPFGECQISRATVNEIVDGKIVQVETDNYNRKHCLRVCLLQNILEICKCSDSFELDGERCKILDPAQDLCKQMVFYLRSNNLLNCSCGTQCTDQLYTSTVSQSLWPSDASMPHILRNIHYLNPKTKTIRTREHVSKNLVRLKIFFDELNYQETREVEDYSGTSLFGDIGGTIGLYIGFSIITFLEFFEFFFMVVSSCLGTRGAVHGT